MNKEITAEDIIKAIDEMFDEEKLQENETFWRGYNHGIMRTQQYIVKLIQELQEIKKEHSIMKQFIYENGLWEKFLNDDRFIEHLRSE